MSRAWLYRRYVTWQRTAQQIADESGWSSQYIRDQLRAHAIALRPPGTASKKGTRLDGAALQRALEQGLTVTQIAERTGYSVSGVYRLIRRHQLNVTASPTLAAGESTDVLAEVARLYRDERLVDACLPIRQPGRRGELGWIEELEQLVEQGLSTAQISKRVGRSTSTVLERLRARGLTAARPLPRPKLSPALLRRLYVDEQHTLAEIARELQVTERRVSHGLAAAGIPRRRAGRRIDPPGLTPISGEDLHRLYVVNGQSIAAIARTLDCSRTRVLTALHRHGIAKRDGRWVPPAFDLDAATLRRLYVDERLDDEAIAARYSVPAHRVRQRRRQLKVARAPAVPPHPPRPTAPSAAVLARLYRRQHLTLAQIARRYHTSSPNVRQWLDEAGIAVQPRTSRQHRKRLDLARVRLLYEEREWTAAEVAADLDATVQLVLRTMHENGIPVRPGGSRRSFDYNEGEQLLTALYCDPDVAALLRRHHVPARPQTGSLADRFPAPVPLTDALLRDAYSGVGLASRHIELLTGQPAEQILDALHLAGIPVRRSGLSPWLAAQRQQRARPRRRTPRRTA